MDYGPFKTEHRVDGMTLIRFPEGEPTVASNVEVFCFQRIAELEAALMQVAAFADVASDANWRDIVLRIKRQISEIQPAS